MNIVQSECGKFVAPAPAPAAAAGAAPFLRRGAWLFLPRPWLRVADVAVEWDKPLASGDGLALRFERFYRCGSGASAKLYVMGRGRDLGHESITLPYWHRAARMELVMESESRSDERRMTENRLKPDTARLHRAYRCWSIWMEGETLDRFITEGSWCFIAEAQTLTQRLNRMDAATVNAFVDGGELERYLAEHMVRGPGKNKRDRPFGL